MSPAATLEPPVSVIMLMSHPAGFPVPEPLQLGVKKILNLGKPRTNMPDIDKIATAHDPIKNVNFFNTKLGEAFNLSTRFNSQKLSLDLGENFTSHKATILDFMADNNPCLELISLFLAFTQRTINCGLLSQNNQCVKVSIEPHASDRKNLILWYQESFNVISDPRTPTIPLDCPPQKAYITINMKLEIPLHSATPELFITPTVFNIVIFAAPIYTLFKKIYLQIKKIGLSLPTTSPFASPPSVSRTPPILPPPYASTIAAAAAPPSYASAMISEPTITLHIGRSLHAFGSYPVKKLFTSTPSEPSFLASNLATAISEPAASAAQATQDFHRFVNITSIDGTTVSPVKGPDDVICALIASSPERRRLKPFMERYITAKTFAAPEEEPSVTHATELEQDFYIKYLPIEAFTEQIKILFGDSSLTPEEITLIYEYCNQTTNNPCYTLCSIFIGLLNQCGLQLTKARKFGLPLKVSLEKKSDNKYLTLFYEKYFDVILKDNAPLDNGQLDGDPNQPILGIQLEVVVPLFYDSNHEIHITPKTFDLLLYAPKTQKLLSAVIGLINNGSLREKHLKLIAAQKRSRPNSCPPK